jgi:hypothetical protein
VATIDDAIPPIVSLSLKNSGYITGNHCSQKSITEFLTALEKFRTCFFGLFPPPPHDEDFWHHLAQTFL